MTSFLSVGLTNVGPFEDVSFKFSRGLTTVYGLNQAEGAHSSNGNAAGKSFLFSAPAEILYEEPIIGEKQDRMREGTRSFSFKNHKGQTVDLQREGTGKLLIHVDGKNVTPRAAAARKALLKKHFPISQDKYNTYIHVDARKPHPLVMGTSTERKNFFTSFFPLGQLDDERKLYQKELLRLKKERAVYSEVKEQYKKAKAGLLDSETRKKYKMRIAKIDKRIAALLKQQGAAMEVKQVLDFFTGSQDDIKLVLGTHSQGDKFSTKIFERWAEERQKECDWDKKQLKLAEEWLDWHKGCAKYQTQLDGLSPKARKWLENNGDNPSTALKWLNRQMRKLRDAVTHVEKLDEKIDDVRVELRPFKKLTKIAKPEGYTEDTSDIQTLLSTYKHQLDHAEKFSEGKCEYCGSHIKIKDPSTLKKKIKQLRKQLEDFKEYRQYRKDKKEAEALTEKLADLQKQRGEFLPDIAEQLKRKERIHDEIKNLPDAPGEYTGKYKGKTPEGVDQIRKRLERSEEVVRAFKAMRPYVKLLKRALGLTEDERKEAERFLKKDITSQIQDAQAKVAKWQAALALHNTLKADVKKLGKRVKKLKAEVRLIEPLKQLVEGFQDKNIKRMAIEALSRSLMKQVNHYARMVFPEDYKFSFDWTATQVSILVHRRFRGKSKPPTDVRKLSGAESKLFTLVLILALMTYVPKHERCTVLILDEPAANFHSETHMRFKKLLPLILKIIPSVVIITPKHEERYDGARNYTIYKNSDGVASIRKGHPLDFMKPLGAK